MKWSVFISARCPSVIDAVYYQDGTAEYNHSYREFKRNLLSPSLDGCSQMAKFDNYFCGYINMRHKAPQLVTADTRSRYVTIMIHSRLLTVEVAECLIGSTGVLGVYGNHAGVFRMHAIRLIGRADTNRNN